MIHRVMRSGPTSLRNAVVPVVILVAAMGCRGGDGTRDTALADEAGADTVRPYVAGVVHEPGSISGAVEWRDDGSGSRRSSRGPCAQLIRRRMAALVWLTGIRSGKRPGAGGRFELVASACGLEPVVQAVIVGGTLNVRNVDSAEHRLRFTAVPGSRPLREVTLIPGAMVIPVRNLLSRPRRILVSCARHPGERAWLVTLDHPYSVMVDARRAFTIDSVPPGRHRITAWDGNRPPVSDSVNVEAGTGTRILLRF